MAPLNALLVADRRVQRLPDAGQPARSVPAPRFFGNYNKIKPLACPRNRSRGHSWIEMTRRQFLLEWMGSITFFEEGTQNFDLISSKEGPDQARQRSVCSS